MRSDHYLKLLPSLFSEGSTITIIKLSRYFCVFASFAAGIFVNAIAMALSFSGPEVLKLDWSTRSLNVSDIDKDGLNDLVVINNDTAKIEIFYQLAEGVDITGKKRQFKQNRWEPVLEDARFESEAITIGFPLFDLTVGDLNGDGRDDLAYTGRESPLSVRFQGDSGEWTNLEELQGFEALGWTGTTKISDLNADGRAEIIIISADGVHIIEQGDDGRLYEKDRYYATGQNPFNLIIEDVTSDNRPDIVYISYDGKQSLVMREQLEDGGFGPELRFPFDRPVRSICMLPKQEGETVQFCSVDSRSGSLEFFELEQKQILEENEKFPTEQPEIYPIFKKAGAEPSYAFGDLNFDGLEDLLVSNPGKAEVVLFLKSVGYFQSPKTFPSFSEISSMSYGRFFEGNDPAIAIVSVEEQIMGISLMNEGGRIQFPRQIMNGAGDPLVCQAVDLDEDGYHELAFASKIDDVTTLILAKPLNRGNIETEWVELSRVELEDIKRKPDAILEVAIFEENRKGLMVFIPREAPLLFSVDTTDSSQFREIAKESTIRESLLKDAKPVQVTVIDMDADGKNDLVVGQSGYARALQLDGETLEMIDQFNARSSEDTVSAIIPVHDEDSVQELIFYVEDAGEFQLIKRDGDDVYRYNSSMDVGNIELKDCYQLSGYQGADGYIFAGADRFWNLNERSSTWQRVVKGNYETDLEDVFYAFAESADFDCDNLFEVIAIDGQNHVVEILSDENGDLKSQMFWEIFEQNLHYQGRNGSKTEPRQVVIADLTNDGKLDFAFLLHDRILFYPQK